MKQIEPMNCNIVRRSSIKENRTDAYLFFNQRVNLTDPNFNPINVIDSIHPGLFSTTLGFP